MDDRKSLKHAQEIENAKRFASSLGFAPMFKPNKVALSVRLELQDRRLIALQQNTPPVEKSDA